MAVQPEATEVLRDLWQQAGLPVDSLVNATLTGHDPSYPSSFHVGLSAQAMVAAAALAACELGVARGASAQNVTVDLAHASAESSGWYSVDGEVSDLWDPIAGLYACKDGWVRVHANLLHHRTAFLQVLGLNAAHANRADCDARVMTWAAEDLEAALVKQGGVGTMLRTFEQWDSTPQGQALAQSPLFTIDKIGDAPPNVLPPLDEGALPLTGVRYLDLTRILAGPVAGRTIAGYGADVLLVNSPQLPNIDAIADTSRGKLSAYADLKTATGREALTKVLGQAHVFVQGYRHGGLIDLGFGPAEVAAHRPGIIYVSLSAYGHQSPWFERRGFDSLVQTAMGFNSEEQAHFGDAKPRPMPMQILDEATGFLIAFLVSTVLRRQQLEGASWHIQVSLAQTARWFRALGRVDCPKDLAAPDVQPYLEQYASGFGDLAAVRHSAILSRTPSHWARPSMPLGSHPMSWPR